MCARRMGVSSVLTGSCTYNKVWKACKFVVLLLMTVVQFGLEMGQKLHFAEHKKYYVLSSAGYHRCSIYSRPE